MLMIEANSPPKPRDPPPPPEVPPVDDDGQEGDDSGRWVTVATFSVPQQAHLARLRLESEEIDCFLIDENLVATDWLLANAVGGIKVQVHEDDVAAARTILGTHAALSDLGEESEIGDPPQPVTCPACGSADVDRSWFSRRLFFLAVLIGLPLPVPMRISRCTRCHHEWKHRAGFPVYARKPEEN